MQGEMPRASGLEKVLSASLLGTTEIELVRGKYPGLEELASASGEALSQLGVAQDVGEHLVRAARLEIASSRLNVLLGVGEGKTWSLAEAGFDTAKLVASAPKERIGELIGGAAALAQAAAAEVSLLLAAGNLADGEPGSLRDAMVRAPRAGGPGQAAMQRLVKLERRLIPLKTPEERRERIEEAEKLSMELLEGTPGQPDLWLSVAFLRASAGRWSGCLEAVGETLKRAPGDRISLRAKAIALEATGRGDSGKYYHHKSLRLLIHENRLSGTRQ